MTLPPKKTHDEGNKEISLNKQKISALIADTFDGKPKGSSISLPVSIGKRKKRPELMKY